MVSKFCLVCFFTCLSETGVTLVLRWLHTMLRPLDNTRWMLRALPSTSASTKDLIIMNPRSEDLVFSPSHNSTVWPWANSSFLSLRFLLCATMGSTKRVLKNLLVLKCDEHDIDDKEDDAHEAQVHSDSLNDKLGEAAKHPLGNVCRRPPLLLPSTRGIAPLPGLQRNPEKHNWINVRQITPLFNIWSFLSTSLTCGPDDL